MSAAGPTEPAPEPRRRRRPRIPSAAKADVPTAGTQTVDRLGFVARLLTHIANPGLVRTR